MIGTVRRVDVVKTLTDMRQVLGGDSVPRILHLNDHLIAGQAGADGDDAAGRRVTDRVAQQIVQHLLQPHVIDQHRRKLSRQIYDQLDLVSLPQRGRCRRCDALDHGWERRGLAVNRQLAHFGAREHKQIVQQALQAQCLAS